MSHCVLNLPFNSWRVRTLCSLRWWKNWTSGEMEVFSLLKNFVLIHPSSAGVKSGIWCVLHPKNQKKKIVWECSFHFSPNSSVLKKKMYPAVFLHWFFWHLLREQKHRTYSTALDCWIYCGLTESKGFMPHVTLKQQPSTFSEDSGCCLEMNRMQVETVQALIFRYRPKSEGKLEKFLFSFKFHPSSRPSAHSFLSVWV